MRKKKTVLIDGWLSEATLRDLREVADQAGVKLATVLQLALAVEVRRWNRESGVRAERDAAVDTLRKIASGKRRTREQRLALSCVTFLDECSNVPPNARNQRRA